MIEEEIDKEIENRLRKLGTATAPCIKCGKEIFFIKTKNDKFAPVTMQLISHFADCKFADDFKKKKDFSRDWVSDCCGAKVTSESGIGDFRQGDEYGIGQTHYFICSCCKAPCNIVQLNDTGAAKSNESENPKKSLED